MGLLSLSIWVNVIYQRPVYLAELVGWIDRAWGIHTLVEKTPCHPATLHPPQGTARRPPRPSLDLIHPSGYPLLFPARHRHGKHLIQPQNPRNYEMSLSPRSPSTRLWYTHERVPSGAGDPAAQISFPLSQGCGSGVDCFIAGQSPHLFSKSIF